LAFAYDISSTNAGITLLDMVTQQETQLAISLGPIVWIGFTPDDRRLLTVSLRTDAGKSRALPYDLTTWDIDNKRQLWQRTIGGDADMYRSYAISPDGGAFVAVLNMDGQARAEVFETQDGSERVTIKLADMFATSATFSPDSSMVLTGEGFTDSTIRLWDAHTGKASGTLEGHRSYVSDLLFTSDGKRLISSSGDQTIRLWDWSTRQPAGVLRGHLNEVDGLALAPDGRTLASRCKDGSIYLWDMAKPSRHLGYQTLPSRGTFPSFRFTPDSRSILEAGYWGGELVLLDALTFKETRRS
jgi:WD40 repeat protein